LVRTALGHLLAVGYADIPALAIKLTLRAANEGGSLNNAEDAFTNVAAGALRLSAQGASHQAPRAV
jgi:hypothetical protein